MPASLTQTPGTLRPLLRLVWPVLVEQTLTMMISLSDTLLAGKYLSRQHLAAMTNLGYLLWGMTTMFAVVAVGAMAMTARFVGAGDLRAANRVVNQSFVAGAILAIVATVLGLAAGERLVWSMQLEGESADLAVRFLWFLLPVLPAIMLEQVGIACLRGAGDMFTALLIMALVNVVNVAVSWTLLLGLGPFPQLGWDGIAIGTTTGHLVGGLLSLALLVRGRSGLRVQWALLKPDRQLMRRILRIGFPGGLDAMSVVGCQLFFLSMINRLGDLATAAHGVAIRVESLVYLPGAAFQLAAATLAGQHLGAQNHRQASRSVLTACLLGTGVMFAASVLLFTQADLLVRCFLRPEQVAEAALAAPLLRIVSLVIVPFSLMMILSGALLCAALATRAGPWPSH